jgi:hypothetical protein
VALLEKRRYLNNRSRDFPQVILIVPSHVPNSCTNVQPWKELYNTISFGLCAALNSKALKDELKFFTNDHIIVHFVISSSSIVMLYCKKIHIYLFICLFIHFFFGDSRKEFLPRGRTRPGGVHIH